MHEGYRLTSVATLQAIEDRSNFYRLDWRLLSPFVLTLVHLGKDILSQATFGAGDAVRVGRRAKAFSVIESLQPVSLPLSFVLSGIPQSVTHFKTSRTVVNSTACDRTFIFLRCFIFGTFLLAGRTILSALIHSSYLKTKIKYKDSFINSDYWREISVTSVPPLRHLHCLHPTCCCYTISTNSQGGNPMVLCGRGQTFTMKRETILTPTTTQTHSQQSSNSTGWGGGATWVV